jgi:hypothetical protein
MRLRTRNLLGCICLLIGISITGCKSDIINNITAATSTPATLETVTSIQALNKPSTTTSVNSKNTTPSIEKSNDQATAASNTVQQASSIEAKEASASGFSSKQPKIMGLAIHELKEKVIAQYGKPVSSFVMEDPTEPITVYQYEGFSVGFNSANEIQFIDVSSTKVNPGLNGLHIGYTSSQALEALGKPDKNSSYVMSYNTKTAILKLDIDPKTKLIQSIKLFGVNES